ncbi:hypothetical protein ACHAW6_011072 [Cyclotella cf. meneghiniana]
MKMKLFVADLLFGCSICHGTWAREHETHIRGTNRRQLRDGDIELNIALHNNNIFPLDAIIVEGTSDVTAPRVDHQGAKIKESNSTKSHDSEPNDNGDEQGGDEKWTSNSSKSSTLTSSSPEPAGQISTSTTTTTTQSKSSKVETTSSTSSTSTTSSTSKSKSHKTSKKTSTSTSRYEGLTTNKGELSRL